MEQSPLLVKPSRRAVLSAATAGMLAPLPALAAPPTLASPSPVLPRQQVETALPQLQKLAEDALQRSGIPGMAIAVVYMDEVIYLKGFGVREEGTPAAVGPDTVFQLASVVKADRRDGRGGAGRGRRGRLGRPDHPSRSRVRDV